MRTRASRSRWRSTRRRSGESRRWLSPPSRARRRVGPAEDDPPRLAMSPRRYPRGMDEEPRRLVAAIAQATDERPKAQTDSIMAALVRGAWPGGIGDRVEPAALDWVRRWGPAGVERDYLADCSCVHGRCLVCN